MATKVSSPSSVDPRRAQSTVSTSTSSTVAGSSPKVSVFGAKSGFVIPKNKLSGSMVPIIRSTAKVEAGSTVREENIKQVQRKTKWGADLTQDTAVRKGRALAYQTRVEQITQQLKSGALEIGDDQSSHLLEQAPNLDSAVDAIDNESAPQEQHSQKIEALELERREIIGEILRLNPNYRAPSDYKPLLKEAKVIVPHTSHPGYNFIGLLLGPESNTQKRLEEETGASIRVYGTKVDTGEKREITRSDIPEAQGAYEELYVNVSADTYEKVDAAVALIELLVTPVSGASAVGSTSSSSAVGDNVTVLDPSKVSGSNFVMMPINDVNQGVPRPTNVPVQSGPPQFQPYPNPWYQMVPSNAPLHRPSGFMPTMPSNPVRFPPPPTSNVHSYFGQPPFQSVPRNPLPTGSWPQPPMQILQRPPNQTMPPQNRPMPGQQPPTAYHFIRPQSSSAGPAYNSSQPLPSGPVPTSRPLVSVNPQSTSMAPMWSLPNRPVGAAPPGWRNAPPVAPQPPRPNNITQMSPSTVHFPVRPAQTNSVTITASVPPQPNLPNNVASRPQAGNYAPPAPFPSTPTAPSFSSVPPVGSASASAMMPSSSGASLAVPIPALTPANQTMPSPAPRPLPLSAEAPAQAPHPPAVPQAPVLMPPPVAAVMSRPLTMLSQPVTPVISRPPTMQSQSVLPVMSRPPPTPLAPPLPGQMARPVQLPVQAAQPPVMATSSSGSIPSFSPVKLATTTVITPISAAAAPKPLRPNSGDFTFQPLRAQIPASPTTSRPNPPVIQTTSQLPLAVPLAPSFRPAVQNPPLAQQVGAHGFPRPAVNLAVPNQSPVQPPPSTGTPFSINPIQRPGLSFPNLSPGQSMALATPTGPPSFSRAVQAPNVSGTMPPLPPGQHQNQLHPASRPSGFTSHNQQVINNPLGYVSVRPPPSPGGNQIYDPFSPTSISPQQGDLMNARKP